MIRVLALTQFAFLALGIVAFKIMVHADTTVPPSLESLNQWSLWLFAIPLVWVAFASLCGHLEKAPLSSAVARVIGVIVAVLCFLFLVSATFLPGI